MSLRFYLIVSDGNQSNRNFECKKVSSRLSCVIQEMESFSLDILQAVNICALEVGYGCVSNS